jgi:hypothetical protein
MDHWPGAFGVHDVGLGEESFGLEHHPVVDELPGAGVG